MKDIIIGGGEVGSMLEELLSDYTYGVMDKEEDRTTLKADHGDVYFLHICIPYNDDFIKSVGKYINQLNPKAVIIHSTVKPKTGEALQMMFDIPIISSPVRGRHENFIMDIKKYKKFYGFNGVYDKEVEEELWNRFTNVDVTLEEMDNGRTCELSKIIVDTTYYGWKLVYRFWSDMITDDFNVDSDSMWKMKEDAYQPITYSDKNGVGGHCVLPNLELIKGTKFSAFKNVIERLNQDYKDYNV